MDLLYVSSAYVPSRRASSVHVMRMCAALAGAGHDVTLLTKRVAQEEDHGDRDPFEFYGVAPSFRLRQLARPRRRGGELAYTAQLAREIRGVSPDGLVYARHLFGAVIAAALGRRVVYEVHDMDGSRRQHWLTRALVRSRQLVRMVTISDALRDDLASRGMWPDDGRGLVAHDAADPLPAAAPRALAGNAGRRVGYVGHLYAGRGVDVIVALAERLPECAFHLIGGRDDDVAAWRARAVRPNLHFHGFVPPAELPTYYLALDVLLMPYQRAVAVAGGKVDTARWMSPLKMFEYMAAGRPIVSSDLPVLREVLEHERTALLAPPTDVDAWTACVRQLMREPELAARLGGAALAEFQARYTWSARAAAVLDGVAPTMAAS